MLLSMSVERLTHFFFSIFIFLLSYPRNARATVRDLPGAYKWPVEVCLRGRRGQPKIKTQTHGLPDVWDIPLNTVLS